MIGPRSALFTPFDNDSIKDIPIIPILPAKAVKIVLPFLVNKLLKDNDKLFKNILVVENNLKSILSHVVSKNHGYKEIAIYGMSYAGETLLNELIESDIKIIYGIDKGADSIYSEIEVVKPTDKLKKVDAIVVTSITYFEEIYVDEYQDSNYVQEEILKDILYEM